MYVPRCNIVFFTESRIFFSHRRLEIPRTCCTSPVASLSSDLGQESVICVLMAAHFAYHVQLTCSVVILRHFTFLTAQFKILIELQIISFHLPFKVH